MNIFIVADACKRVYICIFAEVRRTQARQLFDFHARTTQGEGHLLLTTVPSLSQFIVRFPLWRRKIQHSSHTIPSLLQLVLSTLVRSQSKLLYWFTTIDMCAGGTEHWNRFLRARPMTMNSDLSQTICEASMCARVTMEGKHSLTWALYHFTCVPRWPALKGHLDRWIRQIRQRFLGMKFIILLAAVAVRVLSFLTL